VGTFFQTTEIAASPNGPFESLEALVDTEATYTYIPRPFLERLRITPPGTAALRAGRWAQDRIRNQPSASAY